MRSFDRMLVDGDVLLYQATRAAEHEDTFDTDTTVLYSRIEDAERIFYDLLDTWKGLVPGVSVVNVAFSSSTNWRKSVLGSYKNNRKDVRRPLCFKALQQKVKEEGRVHVHEVQGLEADDVLGILSGPSSILVSVDKDFLGVPGNFLRVPMGKDREPELFEVTPQEARFFRFTQALTGDKTDGYFGIRGIGPQKALEILRQFAHLGTQDRYAIPEHEERAAWAKIVRAYEKAGMSADDAWRNLCCASILDGSQNGFHTLKDGGSVHIQDPSQGLRMYRKVWDAAH